MKNKTKIILLLACLVLASSNINFGYCVAPTYTNLSTSSTIAGLPCLFNATFTDAVALEVNGQYIFETNNTGAWVAEGAVNFTSTPETASVSKTLNITVGAVVSYRWNFTNNASESNTTGIQSLTVTNTAPTIGTFQAPGNIQAESYFFLNCTINDADGIAHLKNATIQISCPNAIVLSWDNATATFAETTDNGGLCTLDAATSTSSNVNTTAIKLSWYIKLCQDYPQGNIDVWAANTVAYDAPAGSGSGSTSLLSSFDNGKSPHATDDESSVDFTGIVVVVGIAVVAYLIISGGKHK